MIAAALVIDSSKLNAALHFAQQWSSRTTAQCVNSTAVAVIKATEQLTPFVSISKIDSELGVQVTYARTATGKESTAKRNRRYHGEKMGSIVTTVPLTVLILLARTNRAGLHRGLGTGTVSNYNMRTNSRYALDEMPTKAEMPGAIHRMIASRHSSIKFLISGWVEARRQMRSAALAEPMTFDADTGQPIEANLGRSTPAREGDVVAICIMENLVGMGKSPNAANYNQALMEHGIGPLQQAVDNEAMSKFEHVFKKLQRENLEPEWDRLMKS